MVKKNQNNLVELLDKLAVLIFLLLIVIISAHVEKTNVSRVLEKRNWEEIKLPFLYRFTLFACLLLLLSSCSQNQQVKDSQLALIKTTNPNPVFTDKNKAQDHVQEIKEDVSSLPELYDVAVVKGKKDTLVVYKVKHLHRFKMKKIEKNINKMLEEKYPKERFTVSSDYKIFLEAVRLNERIKTNKFSSNKAEKRLKEIVKMTGDSK